VLIVVSSLFNMLHQQISDLDSKESNNLGDSASIQQQSGTWGNVHEALRKLESSHYEHWQSYKGCYSSWLEGYYQDPWIMLMPLDDHGFHRGDGVFEAVKIQDGAFIDLDAHLQRLEISANMIGMKDLPHTLIEIKEICLHLGRLCQIFNHGLLRLFITRGPGGFSPNPMEVIGHQLYVVIMEIKDLPSVWYEKGCHAMFSTVSAKEPFYSRIKSCNYLPNVLMRKECQDRGYDMTIAIASDGRICEGAGENMFIVTHDKRLLVPRFDYTLAGTTLRVMMRLAQDLLVNNDQQGEDNLLRSVEFADLTKVDVLNAAEVCFVGTTMGVLPIGKIEGVPIGQNSNGRPGEVSKILHQRLMEEFSTNQTLRTLFM
jgi:branched-chain amino acid aminotransferase